MALPENEQLSEDARALLGCVPEDGGTISNPALRRLVGWERDEETDRYYGARDELEDAGLIQLGRGRGGTVRRMVSTEATPVVSVPVEVAESPEALELAIRNEAALYAPLRTVIEGDWARDHRLEPLTVEVTAQQGGRQTGGIWSRPDIVSVEVRTFPYVPGKHIELTTFEVKPSNAMSVQAVYEALAHRRAATHSYVVLHVPAAQATELESAVADVVEVARSHGIGVVTVDDPADFETWEEREVAARVEPDPRRLNDFVAKQLSERARERISERLR